MDNKTAYRCNTNTKLYIINSQVYVYLCQIANYSNTPFFSLQGYVLFPYFAMRVTANEILHSELGDLHIRPQVIFHRCVHAALNL